MRHTPQIIYERLHIKYGQKYLFKIIGEYQNQKTRIECRCNLCGYIWDVSCGVAMSGKAGCKRCSNRLKPTLTEAKQKLTEASQGRYIFELTEYKNAKQRVKCKCNTCGHEWFNKYENLIYRKDGCEKCSLVKTHTKQTMSQNDATTRMNNVSSKNHFKWKFKNGIYETIRTRILCECDVCGYKWESNFSAIVYRNTGCRNCFFVKQSERQRFTQEQVYQH